MQCPKCGHIRGPHDDPNIPHDRCPACGIVYAKAITRQRLPNATIPRPANKPKQEPSLIDRYLTWATSPKNPPPSAQATETDWLRDNLECQRWQTAHIVHAFLSLITGGLWLLVWVLVTASNTAERNKIHRKYGTPEESNAFGQLLGLIALLFLIAVMMLVIR